MSNCRRLSDYLSSCQ